MKFLLTAVLFCCQAGGLLATGNCCPTLRITATGPAKTAQSNKLGTYEYYKLGPDGLEIFKQTPKVSQQHYLYFSNIDKWTVGPDYNSTIAGVHHNNCKSTCPSSCSSQWKYSDSNHWRLDTTIKVECEKWIPCNSRTKETSGTCAWFSCYESRGPTQCIDSKCICDDNYFTEDGEKCIPCPNEPVETCSTRLPTKEWTDDCIPLSLRVKAEFFEKSVKKASKTEILTTSTSSFRSNYKKFAFSLSSSIGFKGFSASAASAFEKVTSSSESFSGFSHRETSKEEEFKSGFLQIERVITTEVSINGKLAKTIERELVDSVKVENAESPEQLKQREINYINDNFGNLAGEEGACLRGNVYTASGCVSQESHEIYKITLDIWDSASCGSNYGPYIEVQSANGEKRNTAFHGPFSKGTKLIWDNNGENRWGTQLLRKVDEFQVTPRNGIIMFRFVGGGDDAFCPKTLTIFTKDGKRFVRSGMTDWVRKGQGENWRDAYEK